MITMLTMGIPQKLLDALTSTSDTSSSAYALPIDWPSMGRALVWQSIIDGTASAINLQLLGAMNDVSAEYSIIDTSTVAAGEMRHVSPINVRFIKVRQVSRT